jgi:hypothetical protein
VRKILCSFPRQADSWHFDKLYRAGKLELELVPQGTLAERIRAAGAGVRRLSSRRPPFGTRLAEGKETRHIDGRDYVLEYPIHADYALIKADRADRWGNLSYRKTARNFGPIMAPRRSARGAGARDRWIWPARPGARGTPDSSSSAWCDGRSEESRMKNTRPQPDRGARGARHSGRRLREPGHRPADAGRGPPSEGREIVLHSENASSASGRSPRPGTEDEDLMDARQGAGHHRHRRSYFPSRRTRSA